ncbi:hypothetical protein B0H13DRAFT_2564595 [Mycena leptocephala]|nr:hypothetical protein B0H13DRAFT_2564595 [Mycena leptocephala]
MPHWRWRGAALHSHVCAFYAEYTAQIHAATPDDDTLIPDYYNFQWDQFSRGATVVDRWFAHLNRYWVKQMQNEKRRGVKTVRNVAWAEWKTNMFNPISLRLQAALGFEDTQIAHIRTKFTLEDLTDADLSRMRVRPVPM